MSLIIFRTFTDQGKDIKTIFIDEMNGYVNLPRNNCTETASIPCVGHKGDRQATFVGVLSQAKGPIICAHIHLRLKTEFLVLT